MQFLFSSLALAPYNSECSLLSMSCLCFCNFGRVRWRKNRINCERMNLKSYFCYTFFFCCLFQAIEKVRNATVFRKDKDFQFPFCIAHNSTIIIILIFVYFVCSFLSFLFNIFSKTYLCLSIWFTIFLRTWSNLHFSCLMGY